MKRRVKLFQAGHFSTLIIEGCAEGMNDFSPANQHMFAQINLSNEELFDLGAQVAGVLKNRVDRLNFKRSELTEILGKVTVHD